jgi:hypothetical protein
MLGSLLEIQLARRLFPCGRGNRKDGSELDTDLSLWLAGVSDEDVAPVAGVSWGGSRWGSRSCCEPKCLGFVCRYLDVDLDEGFEVHCSITPACYTNGSWEGRHGKLAPMNEGQYGTSDECRTGVWRVSRLWSQTVNAVIVKQASRSKKAYNVRLKSRKREVVKV